MVKDKVSLFIAIVILFIAFVMFCNPIAIVGVGERGVEVTLGRVSPQSYSEGVHFVTPFISKIHVMNVKTQKLSTPTEVYTKDIQQARISYVVNYNLMPNHVHEMYREVGKNYVDTILMPAIEGNIKYELIKKVEYGDTVGYRLTDLTYPEEQDLIFNAGSSIT